MLPFTPWAASAFFPTTSPTRSPRARWWSGRLPSSRSCWRIRSTPAPTSMRVEIGNGGRRLIRIADDGCGMLRDDALLAFERHATSKLHDVKDLLSIATLGFRGEALPSIASVSRLLLETRSPEENRHARRNRGRKDAALRRNRARRRHRDHGARSVLQRSGAQEVSALGADGTGAHRLAGDALQPGASGQDFRIAGTAARRCCTSRRSRRCASACSRCSAARCWTT